MPAKAPNLLLKSHHLPYLAGGLAIALTVAVFALSLSGVLPSPIAAAAPTFSGGGPADGATAQAVDATVSIVSDIALAPSSLGTFTSQTSGTTNQLGNIDCISATTCWASGVSGTVLRTTNSGTTWTTLQGTPNVSFPGLDAVDASTAYLAGAGGVIQKTSDAGSSWGSLASGTLNDLMGIGAFDTNTAWAVGDNGTILSTITGGTSWAAQTSNTSNVLFDVFAVDANTVWAVGMNGTIRRTTNGGTTWATEDITAVTTQFNAVSALSSEIAYVVGNGGVMYKTTNGGTSWTAQSSGTTNNLNGIYCVDSNTCWAVGDSGTVVYTSDGSTWYGQTSNTTNAIKDVHGVSASSAWFVGNSGTIHVFGYNNVLLQANTGNTQAGSPSGSNLCTTATLSNSDKTITCNHSALTKNTWYTLTLVGGGGAISNTVGEPLAANVARAFRTIGLPSLSTASFTDGATGVSTTAAITADFDNPISSGSLLGSTWGTRTASAAMNAVHAIDTATALAVGGNGITLTSVDTWTTWAPGAAGNGVTLNGVTFPNPQLGYAVGNSGAIVKTFDLGRSWTVQTSGTSQNLKSVGCADAITCWAVGAAGTILKTTNGGTTWTAQTSGTTEILFGLHVVDSSTAYAVGNSGAVRKTMNGGTTWASANTGATVGNHGDVFCTSATVCWIASDTGLVYRTTDGGTNWTAATPELSITWNGIHFASATTGWVVGTSGRIYTSTDGGVNWTQQTSGTSQDLGGVSFVSATAGVAVGASGVILQTTNGGTTWTIGSSGTTQTMNGAHFPVTGSTGWAVGASGTILRSTSNGVTWASQTSGTSNSLEAVFAIDASTAYVVGASGTILKTTNGTSWVSQTSGTPYGLHGLSCISATTCWTVGGSGAITLALKTTNGGTTWSELSPGGNEHYDVHFFDANTGWISGSGGAVRKTTDGGTSWSGQTTNTTNALYNIAFADANNGIVVGAGGTILTTSNGGTTWTSRTSGTTNDLRGLAMLDANTAWAVGASGTILKTTDGGVNWAAQTSGTTSGLDAAFIHQAGNVMVAVGHSGTIIAPQSNVLLLQNANVGRSGTAGGTDYCGVPSLGNDGSGNSNRRITCNHNVFVPGMWYTLRLVGASNGLASTSGTSDVLSADVTRAFRTAFASGQVFDLSASDMGSLASDGYFTVTGSNSAATQAILASQLRATATTSHGIARITVPSGCTFARSGGGSLDLTALATADAASDITNASGTVRGAIQYGIPNVGISLTSCGSGVTMEIPVPSTVTDATVLDVLKSEDVNFSDNTTRLTTCTVASSTCTFTTTSLSYFAASEPAGAPKAVDETPPAKPTGFSCTSGSGTATCTWTDPTDSDFASVRLLLIQGDVTFLRGTAAAGKQTFTDPNTDTPMLKVGETTTYGIQSVDTSGNRSASATTTVTISSAPTTTTVDTTPPSPPTNLKATSSSSKVTLTWADPKDSDLKLLRVLLLRGEATSIRSVLNKGLETFTDSGTDLIPGLPFTFAIEAEDTSGNKSSRVTTTVTVESGTAPTAHPTTPATTTAPTTPTEGGAPKTTETPTATTHPTTTTEGAPKTTETTTTTAPVTPETELAKGVKADEPLPTADPKATELLKDAVRAITETLAPPCDLTDAERQYLADAFTRSQGRAPSTGADLQFLCSLRADPEHPVDPTKAFPKFRNLKAETLALKNFVNFFRRPPSRDTNDQPAPPEVAERDWWAVKYMAYHLRLLPTSRDLAGERTCLRLFLDRDVDLYKDGRKVRKTKGTPPRDLFDYDFIRACTYSGLQFASAAGVPEEVGVE